MLNLAKVPLYFYSRKGREKRPPEIRLRSQATFVVAVVFLTCLPRSVYFIVQSTRLELLEAWLTLTSVNYHRNS